MNDKKNKDKNLSDAALYTLGGTALAAAPAVYQKHYNDSFVPKGDKNKLLILTEGGAKSFGGKGHEAAAKALYEAQVSKHGPDSAKIMNITDYSLLDAQHKITRWGFQNFTSQDAPAINKLTAAAVFPLSYIAQKPVNRGKVTEEIRNFSPDRAVAFHPDGVNLVKHTGIRPEVVVTDYGTGKFPVNFFWDASRGWIIRKPGQVSHVHAPSDEGLNLVSETPSSRISTVPANVKNFISDKPKSTKRKFLVYDNEGSLRPNQTLNLDPSKKFIAVTGSSTGADVESMVEKLLQSKRQDFQLYTVTGNNKALADNLASKFSNDPRLLIQGFDKQWPEVVQAADFVVARPHGLTGTELAYTKTPTMSVLTNAKDGVYDDSYGIHLVGNSEAYEKDFAMPRAAIHTKNSPNEDLLSNFEKHLDNLPDLNAKALERAQKMSGVNAAEEVLNAGNKTKFEVAKVSPYTKGLAYTGAAALGATGLYKLYKHHEQKRKK